MIRPAAIYARVSSDRQKEAHTIASQTAALIQFAETEGFGVPKEWVFQDEGYSGSSLLRRVWKRSETWRRKDTSKRCCFIDRTG